MGIYPKKMKPVTEKDTCIPMFTAALSTIAKIKKQPQCPSIDEWTKKWCMYAMEYDSAIKRNNLLLFAATWMDLEGIMLIETSQRENDKCQIISLICGI